MCVCVCVCVSINTIMNINIYIYIGIRNFKYFFHCKKYKNFHGIKYVGSGHFEYFLKPFFLLF